MTTSHYSHMTSHNGYAQLAINPNDINVGYWREIKRILFAFQQNREATSNQAEYVVNLMAALHGELQDIPAFIVSLQDSNSVPRGDNVWSKKLLLQDEDMYLKLITYFADYPTPIHDYPDVTIVNLPIAGRLRIDYYGLGHAALESAYPIAKLRRTESHSYGYYEACMCFPWQKNIQEIRSLSDRAVVLSAGLKPTGTRQYSWYLPISPQNTENFFAQRLKRNE